MSDSTSEFERLLRGLQPDDDALRLPDPAQAPEEPEGIRHPAWNRRLKTIPGVAMAKEPTMSVEEALDVIEKAILYYLQIADPTFALLVKASPGTGKTTLAVAAAEMAAARGWRVLYAGPRHNFFGDVKLLAGHLDWWYEWLPRQKGNEDQGVIETCAYADAINPWMAKGYPGMAFCAGLCGWDYINKYCAYHAQTRTKCRIIYGQHQHVWGGHPLEFKLLIGDESPMSAFCHEWAIQAKHIVPDGMDLTQPITEILYELQNLAEHNYSLDGKVLMDALGGATRVRQAVETANIPADALASVPRVHTVRDAERAPYFHLPQLMPLLLREATVAEAGQDYPSRIVINNGYLLLLLRRRVNEKVPRHTIWLDATANEHIYETILRRPVKLIEPRVKLKGKIFQVYDRANGVGALVDREKGVKATIKDLKKQASAIARIYKRVGLITHMAIVTEFQDYPDRGHFYAERGTNKFNDVDALIVAGTPQMPLFEIDKQARMLFFERMRPFSQDNKLPWTVSDKPYNYLAEDGTGRAYPASHFADADLDAVLWQCREAELIQAAHRVRPNRKKKDVWLLENLPVDELPPTRLMAMRELFGAPVGVDCFRWPDVVSAADLLMEQNGEVTAAELAEMLGIGVRKAREYMDKLYEMKKADGWRIDRLSKGKRGEPTKVLRANCGRSS